MAALIQAIVAKLYKLYRKNMGFRLYRRALIQENKWRAVRWGLDGKLIDFGKQKEVPVRDLILELLDFVDDVVDELGSRKELEYVHTILQFGTSADRQLKAFYGTGDFNAVVDQLIAETMRECSSTRFVFSPSLDTPAFMAGAAYSNPFLTFAEPHLQPQGICLVTRINSGRVRKRMNLGKRDDIEPDPLEVGDSNENEKDHSWRNVHSAAQQAVGRASSLGSNQGGLYPEVTNRRILIFGILGGILIVGVLGYFVLNRETPTVVQAPVQSPPPKQSTPSTANPQPVPPPNTSETILPGILGNPTPEQEDNEPWYTRSARITLKLALGALLASLLAFRPRRNSPLTMRNPYVAQTQILLAVVAAALMMVVADNAARAFGIFAAASLVRFRTNIRDPKEITVLLMSLAIGLASGVGKVEVAIILSLFSLMVLSLLEYYETDQVFRAMELTVTTRKVEETDEILKEIFEKKNISSELRKVDREDSDNIGKIVYFVNVGGDLSTDKLSEEIFSSDPENIDSVQWDQKKTSSYIYR